LSKSQRRGEERRGEEMEVRRTAAPQSITKGEDE